MYQVKPSDPQRFALSLLLLHVPCATSFEALCTVNGQVCSTFRDAARALGLLEDDRQLISCVEEASLLQMPTQMRLLFATLLLFNRPYYSKQLFENFKESMSEDFLYAERQRLLQQNIAFSDVHVYHEIDRYLPVHDKSLADFAEMPQLPAVYRPPDIEQTPINIEEERHQGEQMHQHSNIINLKLSME